jgi:ribonuclease PH
LVFTAGGRLVEIQGTAEGNPFERTQLDAMLDVGWQGAERVIEAQRAVVHPVLDQLGLSLP